MSAIRQHGKAEAFRGAWIVPLAGLFLLTVLFSIRLLSDPDLGFHLNAGRWIINHLAIPQTDFATYTVPDHEYIDLHWLFQLFIFAVYTLSGYEGLSILVCILVCTLFYLLYRRMLDSDVPDYTLIPLLLLALLIMEPRFFLRPELFTYLFITLNLIILDNYYTRNKYNSLWILPLIMLVWCNTEGLFMLGFSLVGAYFIGAWIRKRKPDLRLLGWGILTVIVCFVNPYGLRGFLFPFELLSRFQESNIFHEHIKEFQPLFQLNSWTIKEYSSLLYLAVSAVSILFTMKQRKPHELILWIVFCVLSLVAIRNIPLFIIVTLPITGQSITEIVRKYGDKVSMKVRKRVNLIFAGTIFLIILMLIPRLITNAYYTDNLSYNKTGLGLDRLQHPEGATEFLLANHLDGRMINSLSYGGWLSWRMARPVFIDARLEVIEEQLYTEVAESWISGLGALIGKYNPDLLVYDYVRYFSWTPQIRSIPGWHPIFLDGQSVIFARKGYASNIPFPDTAKIYSQPDRIFTPGSPGKLRLLEQKGPSGFTIWLQGFYRKYSCTPSRNQNMASFFLQMKELPLAEYYFLKTLQESCGSATSCYYALAGIYEEAGEPELAAACYRRILEFDPGNTTVQQALLITTRNPGKNLNESANCLAGAEATTHFNTGNKKYKSGDIHGALAEFSTAIRLNPTHSKAYLNRGYIEAVELHEFELAISDFDTAITLDSGSADAYLGRGSSRYSLQDTEGALEDWKKADSLGNKQAHELILKHQ